VIGQPPPINRQPLGLLGLLGIKNGGRYPQHISETLLPTFDLERLYYSGASITAGASLVLNATGFFEIGRVDQNEVWFVEHFCCFSTAVLGAGQSLAMVPAVLDPAGNILQPLLPNPVATTTGSTAATAIRDVYMQSGTRYGVLVTTLVAGPVNATGTIKLARLGM
jgi:hypothetical protein